MHNMNHMGPYLQSFLPFAQKKMGFNRPPSIFFDSDPKNAENVLGKTGFYDPELEEIVVYVDKRHPKDILRSLSHELVHHTQNCRGDLEPEIAGETTPGYAQNNPHMRGMESEAYQNGNLYFRDWEDSVKLQLQETNYKHITGENHKMATYEQLKEEITAKVVATLTEKLKTNVEEAAKPDFLDLDKDGDKEEPMKQAAKQVKEEEEVDLNEEDELEERKKRDTPRDSTRLEPQKLKIQEEEDELEERKKRDTPRDAPRREGAKLKVNEREKGMSHLYAPEEAGVDTLGPKEKRPELEPQAKPKKKDDKPEEVQEAVEEDMVEESEEAEEVVEESNAEWYQNELFENLKKRWTK